MKLRRRPSFCTGRRRRTKRHFSSLGVIVRRCDPFERSIHPLDNGGLRAEIPGEPQRFERQAADTTGGRLQKQGDFGIPKTINGLQGITDQEQRAAIAGRPLRCQPIDQVVLNQRGVLKFVNQKMFDSKIKAEGELGRLIGSPQCIHRGLRNPCEVNLAPLPKNIFEFDEGHAEHGGEI